MKFFRVIAQVLTLSFALFTGDLAGASSPVRHARETIRIMAVGDSLTEGGYNENGVWKVAGGYRAPLKLLLGRMRIQCDFVGSKQSGPVAEQDNEHEGYSGFRIDEVGPLAIQATRRYQPKWILIMLGTNDVMQDHDVDGAPTRMASLVAELVRLSPGEIFVAAPPSTDNLAYNLRLKWFAQNLRKTLVALKLPRIHFLDMYHHADLEPSDFTDTVHPTVRGNQKLARVWAEAIARHLNSK